MGGVRVEGVGLFCVEKRRSLGEGQAVGETGATTEQSAHTHTDRQGSLLSPSLSDWEKAVPFLRSDTNSHSFTGEHTRRAYVYATDQSTRRAPQFDSVCHLLPKEGQFFKA